MNFPIAAVSHRPLPQPQADHNAHARHDGHANHGVHHATGSAPASHKPPVKPNLDDVLKNYQVPDDKIIGWKPHTNLFHIPIPGQKEVKITKTEGKLLDNLN